MTNQTTDTLWAVHVEGPDDVVAQPDRATADRVAAEINTEYERFAARPDVTPLHPRWHAVVVPWDGTAEDHAAELAKPPYDGL